MRYLFTTLLAAAIAATGFSAHAVEKLTYSKDIAPILNENCVNCHRPGDIAPMSLLSYDEVRPWAKAIGTNVAERKMPPWHADPGYGPWKNERSLNDEQIATIVEWVKQGASQGRKSDLPPTPKFNADGWRLGEPDYVIELDEVNIDSAGPDQFYDLETKTDLPEDRWIKSVEILPGSRKVVHHVILWQGANRVQDGWIGAWAAGAEPQTFPEGTGRILKKGTSIIANMHYHPADTDETDKTRIGFHFSDAKDIEKELTNLWVINTEFEIPAGDPNYEAISEFTFGQDSSILSLTPHMHYRGKDFTYTINYPDGRSEELLKVSNYDFNWQTVYEFAKPVSAPAGTNIHCVAHWDNSADNPSNPDPTKTITFGPESYDEMMIGFVDYIVDEGIRPKPTDPMLTKGDELAQQYPGRIFKVTINQGQGPQTSIVLLPLEGDGGMFVQIGNIAGKAPIKELVWTGNDFEGMLSVPGQEARKLTGTIDGKKLDMKMHITDTMEFPIQGFLHE